MPVCPYLIIVFREMIARLTCDSKECPQALDGWHIQCQETCPVIPNLAVITSNVAILAPLKASEGLILHLLQPKMLEMNGFRILY